MNTFLSYILGFISGIASNYAYAHLTWKFQRSKKDTIPNILKDKNWTKSYSNGYVMEIYTYEKDPDYSIIVNEGRDELSDRFKKFPDKEHDRVHWVEMKYKNLFLLGWPFMYLDGSKIFIPVPETQIDTDGNYYDFYNLSKTEFLVFEVIGQSILMSEKTKMEGLINIASILKIHITDI